MTRQEFLEELRIALQGKMEQSRINEHLQYYDNYIMEEGRKGQTEEQVIEQLGSPRLIARTLIDTSENYGREYQSYSYQDEYEQNRQESGGFHADYSQEKGWDVRYGKFRLNSWYGKLILILIAVAVIVLAAHIVAFLLPIVIPVILILLILSFVFQNRR